MYVHCTCIRTLPSLNHAEMMEWPGLRNCGTPSKITLNERDKGATRLDNRSRVLVLSSEAHCRLRRKESPGRTRPMVTQTMKSRL
jgi:hypothetical protein